MRYVMSDPHGEYELFLALLRKIDFKDTDEMFILGDVIDKGKESVRLLKYVFSKDNIHLSMGNHEYELIKHYNALMREDGVDFDAVLKRLQDRFLYDGYLLDWETVDMIEALPTYIEREDFIGVHAGLPLDTDGRIVHPEGVANTNLNRTRQKR